MGRVWICKGRIGRFLVPVDGAKTNISENLIWFKVGIQFFADRDPLEGQVLGPSVIAGRYKQNIVADAVGAAILSDFVGELSLPEFGDRLKAFLMLPGLVVYEAF